MRIIFICGSLEPGCDGVGDYTRRLGGELVVQGHTVFFIALFDRFSKEVIEEIQFQENLKLDVLRIPFQTRKRERFNIVKRKVGQFRPALISLQYVPYSFSNYGIPIALGKWLSALQKNAEWHVMVHEPYVGGIDNSFKGWIIQRGQRLSLILIKYFLCPVVIHTSIPYYRKILSSVNIRSKELGLFGNISFENSKAGSTSSFSACSDCLKAVYFGTVPSIYTIGKIISKLKDFTSSTDVSIEVVLCGRTGINQQFFIESLTKIHKVSIKVLGELVPSNISTLFTEADFGIARVPARLLGKSGTAISMLEHGLPLWVPLSDKEDMENLVSFRPELCFFSIDQSFFLNRRKKIINRLPEVAASFISDVRNIAGLHQG